MPKISQVMMRWRRQASHLGRFTLWCNRCQATQLGRFSLWHNGRRAKQSGLMHAPGVAQIFQGCWTLSKIQQTQINSRSSANSWNMHALRKFSNILKDERFMHKDRLATSANFERWLLHEDDNRPQQTRWKMKAEDTRITTWVSMSKWGKT